MKTKSWKVLGVDPGKNVGLALYDGAKERVVKLCTLQHESADSPQIHNAMDYLEKWQPDLVAIEGQFLKLNVHAMVSVVVSRCAWSNAAELYGKEFMITLPRQWQSLYGINKNKPTKKERLDRIRKEAQKICAVKPQTEHEECAALIAKYASLMWVL